MSVISRKVGYDTARGADEDVGGVHRDAHPTRARARGRVISAIAGERDATHPWAEFRKARWDGKRERWVSRRRVDLG